MKSGTVERGLHIGVKKLRRLHFLYLLYYVPPSKDVFYVVSHIIRVRLEVWCSPGGSVHPDPAAPGRPSTPNTHRFVQRRRKSADFAATLVKVPHRRVRGDGRSAVNPWKKSSPSLFLRSVTALFKVSR